MMKKEWIASVLALTMISSAGLFGGCTNESNKEGTEGEYATVWSALSTEKYMQLYKEEASKAAFDARMGKTEAKLDFVGMKGETQSAQLMITANKYIKGFDLDVSDLTDASGNKIAAENIKVYAEKYVEIYAPFVNQSKHGEIYYSDAGFYPDALVPIEAYQMRREDRIEEGHNQGIWVDVEIPSTAVAGEYTGTFKLTLADTTMDIPVSLKTYNLTMPEEVHSKTMFNIWYEQIGYGEGDNMDKNTNQVYYDYLLEKRLCSGNVNPNYTKDLASFLEEIPNLAANSKVTSYIIPHSFIGFNKDIMRPRDENAYTQEQQLAEREKIKTGIVNILEKMLAKNIALRAEEGKENIDLFKKAYFYYEDEPARGYRTERVKIFCQKLTEAKKAVLTDPKNAEIFAANPDLKISLAGVQEICPSNLTEEKGEVGVTQDNEGKSNYTYYDNGTPDDLTDDLLLGGDGLTLWCPENYKWRTDSFAQEVKKRQAQGEDFWWYTCVANSPVMSYYVEAMPISMRMYSWMQYEYGIEGVLYWDVVHWGELADPYEDIQYYEYGGGEGLLLYPGAKYGQKTPISSIRLEQLRAGQQDYEYLYMLDAYMLANSASVTATELVAKIGENFYDGAYTLVTASEAKLEDYRISILDILQDYADGKASDAQTKINAIMQA